MRVICIFFENVAGKMCSEVLIFEMVCVNTSIQHPQQPATNVHGLNRGGHPYRWAAASSRKVVARVQKLIPYV